MCNEEDAREGVIENEISYVGNITCGENCYAETFLPRFALSLPFSREQLAESIEDLVGYIRGLSIKKHPQKIFFPMNPITWSRR